MSRQLSLLHFSLAAARWCGSVVVLLAIFARAASLDAQPFAPAVTYPTGYNPMALAVGDFNGDGRPDVAVVNAANYTVSIHLNTGNGVLARVPSSPATGANPVRVVAGDFNGDGKLDLAVANSGSRTLGIYLGNGDGTFRAPTTLALGFSPGALAVADLNGDGRLDLALTNASTGRAVAVLMGNGDGSFASAVSYVTGSNVVDVALADLNGDGKPDLIVANNGDTTISTMLNNGDGTFAPRVSFASGYSPSLLATADFNGDGKIDLVVQNGVGFSIHLGRGDGSFLAAATTSVGFNPSGLAVGDFDGDGIPDFAINNLFGVSTAVLFGKGDGTFRALQSVATGRLPDAVAAGRFRGNGASDLVTTARIESTLAMLLNTVVTAPPATLSVHAGSPQGITIGSAFATTLSADVRDAAGRPVAGALVTFTAPASGASASFPGGVQTATGISDLAGVATAPPLTANLTPGAYTVAATVGALSAAFSLTNIFGNVAPLFTSGAPPGGQWQSPYSYIVHANGVPAPGYAVSGGALPPGLSLAPASGAISGTPSSTGTFSGVITANNGINPAATQTFSIVIGPAAQTIAFAALPNKPYGSPSFTVTASASSGLPVTFSVTTPAYCGFSGTYVNLYAVGTCTVRALQAGNANYASAANVDQSFAITAGLLAQSITFNLPATTAIGNVVALGAVATSGLPVSYLSLTSAVCIVNAGSVQANAAGTCTIRTSQPGNATYSAAPNVDRSMTVTAPLAQTITFAALADKPLAAPPFTVGASASSGLAITFSSQTTSVCTLNGATVSLAAAGTCTIRASQPGSSSYAAAPNVDRSFQVTAPTAQSISFAAPADQPVRAQPFTLSAAASSGLPVTFATLTPAVCALASTTVSALAVGTCTIRASQAGNASFAVAPNVDRSFAVIRAAQSITFFPIALRALGSAPFEMVATATSGLAVTFASLTPTTCRVNDQWLAFLAVGTCTIRASQSGNGNFLTATNVEQSLQIAAAYQSLLFPQPATQTTSHPQFTPSATASSGLPVTLSSLTQTVCTSNGSTVTLLAAGTCTIRATQSGNATYIAVSVDRSFQVQANAGIAASVTAPGPIIAYSTLLGGFRSSTSSHDTVFDVVVAPDGSALVGGAVADSYFPGLDASTITNGGLDLLFVARMRPDRGALDTATAVGARSLAMTGTGSQSYFGTPDTDMAEAIAVDNAGTAYVAAYVNSRAYPLTGGTYVRAGPKAIFRVSGDGSVAQLSVAIDPAVRTIRALAVDAQGGIYFTGFASAGLSTTAGAAIAAAGAPAGGPYLIKIAPGGANVVYSTYLSVSGSRASAATSGQSSIDSRTTGYALVVDASGNAYVAGQANAGDFPVTPGSPDTADNQNRDAFVAKVNPAGSALTWVARLGGIDAERATSIALAPDGSVVIGGKTASKPFYGTNNAFQYIVPFQALDPFCYCTESGFVAKLAPDGSQWVFVAALGTSGGSLVRYAPDVSSSPVKVAVDAAGAIYAAGFTDNDRQLPVGYRPRSGDLSAIQSPGFYDDGTAVATYGSNAALKGSGGFLMKMSGDGRELLYSVIVNRGPVVALKVDAFGAAYVAGVGAGPPQIAAAQAAPGSVFVAKVLSQPAPIVLAVAPSPSTAGAAVSLTASLADARYAGTIEFRDGNQLIGSVPVVDGSATLSLTPAPGVHRLIATFIGGGPFNGAQSTDIVHAVNQSGAAQ